MLETMVTVVFMMVMVGGGAALFHAAGGNRYVAWVVGDGEQLNHGRLVLTLLGMICAVLLCLVVMSAAMSNLDNERLEACLAKYSPQYCSESFGLTLGAKRTPVLDRTSSMAGEDIDNNGVRDDIDSYISERWTEPAQQNAVKSSA